MQDLENRADGLEPLDAENKRDVQAVAEMHLAHFPRATESRCGLRFLADFYYPTALRAGLIGCTVARRGGRVVSFITYTRYPRTILKTVARRRPVRFAIHIARACLTQWSTVKAVARHARFSVRGLTALGAPPISEGHGEVLLLVTQPEHQTWAPPGGDTRVTVRLFYAMEEYFRRAGVPRVLLAVMKDNPASQLFCHSMGCELDPTTSTPDYHYFWYDIPPAGPRQ